MALVNLTFALSKQLCGQKRGLSADQLILHDLWWCGPPWLEEEKESWPVARPKRENVSNLNQEITVNVVSKNESKWDLFEKFST